MARDASTQRRKVETLVSKLKEHFRRDGVEITICQQLPSYLTCFSLKANEGIILVHKPIVSDDVSVAGLDLNESHEPSTLDVTGNPLEHPFDDVSILNESTFIASEITFMPPGVPTPLSREICSLYSMHAPVPCVPLWVVCDGNEIKGNGRIRLNYAEKLEGRIVLGFATDTGSLEKNPDVKTLVAAHANQLKKNCPTSNKISCLYKLANDRKGSCSFEMTWNEPVFHPPTTSSSLSISGSIEFITGSGVLPLSFMWEQLRLINDYIIRLESDQGRVLDKLTTNEAIMSHLEKSEMQPIDRILDILREPIRKSRNPIPQQLLVDFIREVSSPSYSELDALGKLWYLLLECPTVKELGECLDRLSVEMREKRLGSHLNQIRSATSIGLDIQALSPLKLLVEFGIVKMRKEMMTILSEAQVSTRVPDLPRFSTLRLSDWRQAVNNSMRWLAQSYSLLELLVKLQEVLPGAQNEHLHGIALNYIRSMAPDAPRDVEWFVNNPVQRLQSPLRPELADNIVRERFPNNWLMTIKSKYSAILEVENRFACCGSRIFVPPEAQNVDMTNISMNNTVSAFASGDSTKLWSAELLLNHHSQKQW